MIVTISIDGIPERIEARIEASESKTYKAFSESLPMEGRVSRWGDEIYFYVRFKATLERGGRSRMNVGEIAYWPTGPALAIFFGPTPASEDGDPMAASDCNVIGSTDASPEVLRRAKDGAKITITKKSA